MSSNFIQNYQSGIYKINTGSGTGTGFYHPQTKLIVTNFHVVQGFRHVALETIDNKKIRAQVAAVNPQLDIAILVPQTPLVGPDIRFAKDGQISISERVNILGFPLGMPFSVTEGIVSSPSQEVRGVRFIQTDAAINPGNSGGPMLNQAGEVVGMATAKFTSAENIGFVLPISHVIEKLESMDLNDLRYNVSCPSCSHGLFEAQEHCDNCGVEIDTFSYFEELPLSPLATFVESALSESGVDPVACRLGKHFWTFYQGSALVRIFQYDHSYLFATSPLVDLPNKNLEGILKYVLSYKDDAYTLGVRNKTVYISFRMHLADLDNDKHLKKLQRELSGIAKKADELDNYLIKEFGCLPTDTTLKDEISKAS